MSDEFNPHDPPHRRPVPPPPPPTTSSWPDRGELLRRREEHVKAIEEIDAQLSQMP